MIQRFTRLVALVALVTALMDAGRLLGVGGGSPVDQFGREAFILLGGFTVARLFAAVGMWIESNWGTSLLFIGTLAELVIYLSGIFRFDIGITGFILRLVLLVGASLLLWFAFQAWRREVHD